MPSDRLSCLLTPCYREIQHVGSIAQLAQSEKRTALVPAREKNTVGCVFSSRIIRIPDIRHGGPPAAFVGFQRGLKEHGRVFFYRRRCFTETAGHRTVAGAALTVRAGGTWPTNTSAGPNGAPIITNGKCTRSPKEKVLLSPIIANYRQIIANGECTRSDNSITLRGLPPCCTTASSFFPKF